MRYFSSAFFVAALCASSAMAAAPQQKSSSADPEAPTTLSGSSGEWQYRYAFSSSDYKNNAAAMSMGQALREQSDKGKAPPLGAVILARVTPNVSKKSIQQLPWRLSFMVPLSFSLLQPLRVVFDQGGTISLPWQMCAGKVCIAMLELNEAQVNLIRRAKFGRILVNKVDGGVFTIPLTVDGAGQALSSLERWVQHPPVQ